MSNPGVVRRRKDGGYSICKAAEENIGKRKCCHVLDNASMEVRKEKSTNFIDISGQTDGKNSTFSIEASEKEIKTYMKSLSKGLTKRDRNIILATLRG